MFKAIKRLVKRFMYHWRTSITIEENTYEVKSPDVSYKVVTYEDDDITIRKTWVGGRFAHAYLRTSEEPVTRTEQVRPEVFLDYNREGIPVGVGVMREVDLAFARRLLTD